MNMETIKLPIYLRPPMGESKYELPPYGRAVLPTSLLLDIPEGCYATVDEIIERWQPIAIDNLNTYFNPGRKAIELLVRNNTPFPVSIVDNGVVLSAKSMYHEPIGVLIIGKAAETVSEPLKIFLDQKTFLEESVAISESIFSEPDWKLGVELIPRQESE